MVRQILINCKNCVIIRELNPDWNNSALDPQVFQIMCLKEYALMMKNRAILTTICLADLKHKYIENVTEYISIFQVRRIGESFIQ